MKRYCPILLVQICPLQNTLNTSNHTSKFSLNFTSAVLQQLCFYRSPESLCSPVYILKMKKISLEVCSTSSAWLIFFSFISKSFLRIPVVLSTLYLRHSHPSPVPRIENASVILSVSTLFMSTSYDNNDNERRNVRRNDYN